MYADNMNPEEPTGPSGMQEFNDYFKVYEYTFMIFYHFLTNGDNFCSPGQCSSLKIGFTLKCK